MTTIESNEIRSYMMDKPVAMYLRDRAQNWVVMSVAALNGPCVMIYGCKSTEKEAKQLAQKARDANDTFDVFVKPSYTWLPLLCPETAQKYVLHGVQEQLKLKDGGIKH